MSAERPNFLVLGRGPGATSSPSFVVDGHDVSLRHRLAEYPTSGAIASRPLPAFGCGHSTKLSPSVVVECDPVSSRQLIKEVA